MTTKIGEFPRKVKDKNPGEIEFHQAVGEVVESVPPRMEKRPRRMKARILAPL